MNNKTFINFALYTKIAFYLVLCFTFFLLGWFGHETYSRNYITLTNCSEVNKTTRILDGLYFEQGNSSGVLDAAKDLDDSGQWICINIDPEMNPETIIETCVHESMHELFAQKCTINMTKCLEALK
jgi:hypothetical protein